MTTSDPDVTEKVERTDVGFCLTVKSKRGTGTNDRDEVQAELLSEDYPSVDRQNTMVTDVKRRMSTLRAHQPDEEDGGNDD